MDLNQFKEQVLPQRDKMYRFALGFLRNKEEARDIVQEVFLKMWEERRTLENVVNISAWSMTLVRNKALDRLKSGQRRLVVEYSTEQILDSRKDGEDPLLVLTRKETMVQIKAALHKMPELQRSAFNLREFRQCSYAEIAEILKVDMNNVKVLIHRARAAIRQQLQNIGEYGYRND